MFVVIEVVDGREGVVGQALLLSNLGIEITGNHNDVIRVVATDIINLLL